ncbi:hypothetical protein BDZ94DRAFT_1238758 [Collybia nuda]|uniref:DUF6533 domain-containing protein n=1 Tax=Collybia nuda TaxID=64659 RepID=A0A9P5XZS0_9AGAR|nr:hypothetical protein BDZ94DRAFT_1238758 [Collybia nuda]
MWRQPASDGSFNSDPLYPQVLNSLNLVAMTILLFDHTLTFRDEVNYFWKRKMSFFSVLFLANRYYADITMEHIQSKVSKSHCRYTLPKGIFIFSCYQQSPKFVPFGSQTGVLFDLHAATIFVAEIILILRVYSIYERNKIVLACLTFILTTHIALELFLRGVFGSNIMWIITGFVVHYVFKPRKVELSRDCTNAHTVLILIPTCPSITTTMIGRLTLSLKQYGAGGDGESTANITTLRFTPIEVSASNVI